MKLKCWKIEKTENNCGHLVFAGCKKAVLAISGLVFFLVSVETALSDQLTDTTSLMFVGEQVDMVGIASKREESAWDAPAVADVIDNEDISTKGYDTLAEALGSVSGFYMAQKEWGTQPYLRGIADSVLFLYDTVPMGSELSKSFNFMDKNLSLASVKKIEIIKGPGSVLWGPDAFAGIVNVVPYTGKDFRGVETGAVTGFTGKKNGGYLNLGGATEGGLDGFISVSARRWDEDDERFADVVTFWENGNRPTPPYKRFGTASVPPSDYMEVNGNASLNDKIILSGRFSDYSRPYSRSDQGIENTWIESRDVSSGFMRLEYDARPDTMTALRFNSAYTWINPETKIVDKVISQKEQGIYSEVTYDRSLLEKDGLITFGASWRYRETDDAPVWDGYFPDYFSKDNLFFLPSVSLVDSLSRMWSVFAQYRHTFGNVGLWAGMRKDSHELYGNYPSFNSGLSWHISNDLLMKIILGTACRTPYAAQLAEGGSPEMESVRSASLNLGYKKDKSMKISMTGFINKIDDHALENPNVGVSEPNHQRIWGCELDMGFSITEKHELKLSSVWQQSMGPLEVYRFNDYSYIVDGEIIKHFVDLSYPYEKGARLTMNAGWLWKLTDQITLNNGVEYFDMGDVLYPLKQVSQSYSDPWVFNSNLKIENAFLHGTTIYFSLKNIFNNEYKVPGIYGTIEARPFQALAGVVVKWQ